MRASGKVAADAYTSNSPLIFEAPDGIERMRIDDVTGNVGIGTNAPLAEQDDQSLHVSNIDLSLSSGPLQSDDILIESNDAVLGLYSSPQGSAGSAITFKEIDAGALVDTWAIVRETSSAGAGLRFMYGFNDNYFGNPTRVYFDGNGNVGIGTRSPDAKLEIGGTPGVDGIMFPDGTVQTTAASGAGSFPAPTYDSGWVDIDDGASIELVDNYVVDMQFKDPPGEETSGIHNRAFGSHCCLEGATYHLLTTTSITVTDRRSAGTIFATRIRIRIWRYEAGAGACCLADGSCAQLKPSDCALQDGSFRHNTSCTPNLCNGACCISGVAGWLCQDDHTAETCAVGTMVYKGDGTQCDDPDLECP